MNIEELYEELSAQGSSTSGESVIIRSGIFTDNDLINVFSGGSELYFRIDKEGLFEILNNILSKISELPPKDDYNHMIDIFNILNNEISNYFGSSNQEQRNWFYMNNGERTDDEYVRICSMSQIKGMGIAQCAEKASLANNILLLLNKMGLFDYKINYMNAITALDNRPPEGHAILEFDRINSRGEVIHIIYDVTNPEVFMINGEECYYPALYALSNEEYESFLNGERFDNSKFIMSEYYQTIDTRYYCGFSKSLDDNDLEESNEKKL